MSINEINNNTENKKDPWDQVETSQDFNTGITGQKLATSAHIEAKKPGSSSLRLSSSSLLPELAPMGMPR